MFAATRDTSVCVSEHASPPGSISGDFATTGQPSAIERLLQRFASDVMHLRSLGGSISECRKYCRTAWPKRGQFAQDELDTAYTILYAAIDDSFSADHVESALIAGL